MEQLLERVLFWNGLKVEFHFFENMKHWASLNEITDNVIIGF
jgi:hypothetical protein